MIKVIINNQKQYSHIFRLFVFENTIFLKHNQFLANRKNKTSRNFLINKRSSAKTILIKNSNAKFTRYYKMFLLGETTYMKSKTLISNNN